MPRDAVMHRQPAAGAGATAASGAVATRSPRRPVRRGARQRVHRRSRTETPRTAVQPGAFHFDETDGYIESFHWRLASSVSRSPPRRVHSST